MLIKRRSKCLVLAVMVGCMALMTGCKKDETKPPQFPEVTVAQPLVMDVTVYAFYPGRLEAVAKVDLRARVQGFLLKNNFVDGQYVKENELLFEIDPKPFQAKVLQCKGQLDRAIAANKDAEFNYRHMKEAHAKSVATDTELMDALTKRDTSVATVEAARADLETAQINLSYTKVHTPIKGQISRHYVDVGNLVGSGENTLLGTVIQNDPIYVYFDISGNDLQSYMKMLDDAGKLQERRDTKDRKTDDMTPIGVKLSDGDDFDFSGRIDYASIQMNPGTQTLQIRGILKNDDHFMIPGMFADVRVPIQKYDKALLVPDSCIGYGQGGYNVLVVDEHNMVVQKDLKVGQLHGTFRVVTDGLAKTDKIIIDGLQYARVGYPTKYKQETLKYKPRPKGVYVPGVAKEPSSTKPTDDDVKKLEKIETHEEQEKQDLEVQEKQPVETPDKKKVPATQKAVKDNV